tara:strand:- start:21314 stop:21811 length:498 start_codon:yes stop_codon:yes gene_type:complete
MENLFGPTMTGRIEWDNLPQNAKDRRQCRKKGYNQDAWNSEHPNRFTMIESASHGWLQVTLDQANAAAVAGNFKYGTCSYVATDPRSGNEYVYLEEDLDMPAFLFASGNCYFEAGELKWKPEYEAKYVWLETFRPPGKSWVECRNYKERVAKMTAADFIKHVPRG